MIEQIIHGVIGGVAYSISGLIKKDKDEAFNYVKMAPTIIVGAIVGAVAGLTNQDFGIVANTAGIAGITAFVENSSKAIWRKFI